MFEFDYRGLRLGIVAVLLFSGQAQAQSPLQQIADEAALTAVQVLGAGGTSSDAVAAAQQLPATLGMKTEVGPSSVNLTVTVKVSAADTKAPAVSSTARYQAPDHTPQWTWASRQRFAVKASPVMVGSSCLRDCEPNPLR